MFKFAFGLSGSRDLAEELVQRTFERGFAKASQWQSGARLDSWLFRILQSIYYDDLNAAKVRGPKVEEGILDNQIGEDGSARAEAELLLDSVFGHIQALGTPQREALLLVAVLSQNLTL